MRTLLNAVRHFQYIFFSSFIRLLGKEKDIEIKINLIKIKKIKIFQVSSLAYSSNFALGQEVMASGRESIAILIAN